MIAILPTESLRHGWYVRRMRRLIAERHTSPPVGHHMSVTCQWWQLMWHIHKRLKAPAVRASVSLPPRFQAAIPMQLYHMPNQIMCGLEAHVSWQSDPISGTECAESLCWL